MGESKQIEERREGGKEKREREGKRGRKGRRRGEREKGRRRGNTLTHKNWPPCEKPMTLNPSLSDASAVRFAHTSVIWSLAFIKNPFSVSSLTSSPI